MPLDFFLNELSYRALAKDVREARERMAKLVAVLSSLKRATAPLTNVPQFRMDEDFPGTLLAPDYTVAKWRGDTSVDQTLRLFFKTYAAQSPYLRDVPKETTDEFPELYSYTFEGTECKGLGYAHLLRGVAISLATERCWEESSIELTVQYLTQENEEQFEVQIPHVSDTTQVEANQTFLDSRIAEEARPPKTLSDLWEGRTKLFPHLEFCPRVEVDLELLEPVQHLTGVWSSLSGYNDYARKWMETFGNFDHRSMLRVTPESAGRLRDYGHEMTYEWNGRDRVFSLHGRFTPGAGRIHMWADLANKKLVIGYVGMKIGI